MNVTTYLKIISVIFVTAALLLEKGHLSFYFWLGVNIASCLVEYLAGVITNQPKKR